MNAYIVICSLICLLLAYPKSIESNEQNNQENPTSTGNPGKSACGYFGNGVKECATTTLPVGKLPQECTSIFLESLTVNDDLTITNTYGKELQKIFDDVLKSNTPPVYMSYGHATHEKWITFLQDKSNAENEALSLCNYIKEYPSITGIVLRNINIFAVDFPKFSDNLITYIKVLKQRIPKLQIALKFFGVVAQQSLSQLINAASKEIDFTCLNSELDFYVVKLSLSLNMCTKDNRIGGVVPIDGNADNTMTKIQNFLDKVKIPKGQLYYQFQLTASTTIDDPVFCQLTYQKMCKDPKATCHWCADTSETLVEKGKFSKTHGAGFIAGNVDVNDPDGCCCNKPFPSFYYLLDGWNGVTTQNTCPSFDRQ